MWDVERKKAYFFTCYILGLVFFCVILFVFPLVWYVSLVFKRGEILNAKLKDNHTDIRENCQKKGKANQCLLLLHLLTG